MSDTPRTDAEASGPYSMVLRGLKHALVQSDFARQLERELNEANERIKRFEETLHRIANTDYRGNRSTESQIAFEALKEAKP